MNLRNSRKKLITLTAAAFAAVLATTMATSSAFALCRTTDNDNGSTSDWTNQNFALLSLGSPTKVSITGPSSITGTVGIASQGEFDITGPSVVPGPILLGPGVPLNESGVTKTSGTTDNILIGNASSGPIADARSAATYYAGLTQNVFVPNNQINGSMTLTVSGADCNVLDVTNVSLNGGATLNIVNKGGSQASFTLNDSGGFNLTGGSKIILTGFSPGDVLYNITGTGGQVALNGGAQNGVPKSQIAGVLLAVERNIGLDPGLVLGEVVGGGNQIAITSGGQVIQFK